MKTSKKMLALLALNTLAAVSGKAAETKTDRLYKNITKNIQTGKSNSANYKLIESILKEKNKELKDLYLQSDYIIKPEYLEWQVFMSGCWYAPIVKPMPQPIAVESWEMQQQNSEPNYTEKLLQALQQ